LPARKWDKTRAGGGAVESPQGPGPRVLDVGEF
jgi:hypothetical protein